MMQITTNHIPFRLTLPSVEPLFSLSVLGYCRNMARNQGRNITLMKNIIMNIRHYSHDAYYIFDPKSPQNIHTGPLSMIIFEDFLL